MLEYQQTFGSAPLEANLTVSVVEKHDLTGNLVSANVTAAFSGAPPARSTTYLMFYALQMYFMNGGGPCYIVSTDNRCRRCRP